MNESHKYKRSSYLKDKKISILCPPGGIGPNGWPSTEWTPLAGAQNIWAYYRQATVNEFFSSASTQYKVEVVFKIAWRDDLEHGMKILFRGKEYGITQIDDFEGYKQDLTIYAYVIE